MKNYRVWACRFGKWGITDRNINRLYAESICEYWKDHGIKAVIVATDKDHTMRRKRS